MKTRKRFYLLLVTSSIFLIFTFKFIERERELKDIPKDFLELIRKNYDLVDDPIFYKASKIMNDSIMEKDIPIEIQVITEIDETYKTIDWRFWYNEIKDVVVSDRLFYSIDIEKNNVIKEKNRIIPFSKLRNFARKYIFYPDSSELWRTHSTIHIEQYGEIRTSDVSAILNVRIKENNGFSTNDWQFFFRCLHELIELCEEERNIISIKLLGKEFNSLSFAEKETIVDIIGYHIIIRFGFNEV